MVYRINPNRLSFFSIFFLVIAWNLLVDYLGMSIPLFLLFVLLAVVLSSLQFKFKMNDDHFTYQILLFNHTILEKQIYPDQIVRLKMIRVGWAKKAAIIEMNKGFNIRLAVLEPQKAYDDLIDFSKAHDIQVFKSRDYLILEKMKT